LLLPTRSQPALARAFHSVDGECERWDLEADYWVEDNAFSYLFLLVTAASYLILFLVWRRVRVTFWLLLLRYFRLCCFWVRFYYRTKGNLLIKGICLTRTLPSKEKVPSETNASWGIHLPDHELHMMFPFHSSIEPGNLATKEREVRARQAKSLV
jgi:hypothetical protein